MEPRLLSPQGIGNNLTTPRCPQFHFMHLLRRLTATGKALPQEEMEAACLTFLLAVK